MIEQILHITNFFASDILLSLFFFVVGLELVDEFRNGSLRSAKHASLPAFAAFGGVLVPAGIFLSFVYFGHIDVNLSNGWAIPTATDVAFPLAILALFGKRVHKGVKLFLMVLAVVDDIIGIVIIAIAYSGKINALALLGTVICLSFWAFLVRQKKIIFPLLLLMFVLTWVSVYLSGIHPTIAGVLLGLLAKTSKTKVDGEKDDIIVATTALSQAKKWANQLNPICNFIVVPVFAGVSLVVSGYELFKGFNVGISQYPVADLNILLIAIAVSLVIGKPFGVLAFAWVGQHLTPLQLFHKLKVRNLVGAAFLAGIGFTVSFLIAELSLENPLVVAYARVGVLIGSLISALLGYVIVGQMLKHNLCNNTVKGSNFERS